ncbi:hypothetical protein [Chengkuizengella sediminis]|uniref:hypothetical protein n=1 Tax=Chengkuizengella sediminis TaxID=1885917 RepID=UPI00138A4AE3|nr:hypothetical protein [Chengkuizengella sediminis]NDI35748.1 hypothetical protein [Chengkuizengella sediminis]
MPFNNKIEVKQFEFVTPANRPGTGEEIFDNSASPTVVAEITFDCLKPGDRIWLNSIFHLTNNQSGEEPIIDHAILKNNVPIYTAQTEIDGTGDDNIGQIFSQETVDVITTLEKNVTYKVVVSTPSINGTDVFLFGPITFTGTQFTKGKNSLAFNKVEVKQFEFVTPANSPGTGEEISDNSASPTVVAEITFDCLKPGDRIWLNSIFHLTNNQVDVSPLITHAILKNNVPIYTAQTDIDEDEDDNIGQIFSQETVDVITTLQKNVTYKVVVSTPSINGTDVFLFGPITFTGTQFTKGKNSLAFNKVEVKQFEFVTPANRPGTGEEISDNSASPTVVAEITFDCLKPGDRIWLNSIFHLTNNQVDVSPLITHAILKNNVPIYTAQTEIDATGDDNIGQIFSQETVDVITTLEKNVTYKVVVSTPSINGTDVFLFGPITFTGTRFVDGKKGFR